MPSGFYERKLTQIIKKGDKYNKLIALEFHHTDPNEKDFHISDMASSGYSWLTIMKEIDKCEILCANCHRQLNYLKRAIENWEPSEEWLNNKEIGI